MHFSLEIHKYAPELNKIHFEKGGSMKAPGVQSIRHAREIYFKQNTVGKTALIQVVHSDPDHASCDRSYGGRFYGYAQLKSFIDRLKKRHNLPSARITVKSIRLFG